MDNKAAWNDLHKEKRHRPKYPSEVVVQYLFRNFKRDGQERVADLGCGAGRHIMLLAKEGIIPYGVDYSDEGVAYTRSLLKEHGFSAYADNVEASSLVCLPYESDFLDGIICYGVFCYLSYEDLKRAVSEIKRVMKKGGKGLIIDRNLDDYRRTGAKETDEKNTFVVVEQDASKCASKENGMRMHFLTKEEIKELFSDFSKVAVDQITETHQDGAFCDSNYVISITK